MSPFEGHWELEHSEHIDEFLKELHVTDPQLLAGIHAHHSLTVKVDGDHFHWVHEGDRKVEYDFHIGKEYHHDFFSKQMTFTTSKESDCKLVHHGHTEKGKATITREVHGDEMTVTFEMEGIHSKMVRKFKRHH